MSTSLPVSIDLELAPPSGTAAEDWVDGLCEAVDGTYRHVETLDSEPIIAKTDTGSYNCTLDLRLTAEGELQRLSDLLYLIADINHSLDGITARGEKSVGRGLGQTALAEYLAEQ